VGSHDSEINIVAKNKLRAALSTICGWIPGTWVSSLLQNDWMSLGPNELNILQTSVGLFPGSKELVVLSYSLTPLVQMLRIRGAITPLHHMCSWRAQRPIYLYFCITQNTVMRRVNDHSNICSKCWRFLVACYISTVWPSEHILHAHCTGKSAYWLYKASPVAASVATHVEFIVGCV
jgi:hypothetical protein